ncbi:cystathionine beta-synthase [Piromyces finnis]|uniref:Cystathionine beta-synthase n=1 Tax=Piromyces finnis TaxID=1754191 RepID=A0A1Y1VJG7_9FUNG|nr:cystathionine beta-synthase [Piromyces finnis]|eukprot:ORX57202.1 cystathionine beta-synthase [Piromyces finnis]
MAEARIYNTVLEAIGNTPLVRLNKIPQSLGVDCEVLVKCEWFNAGGSVKDRIGLRMVEDAEKAGILKPGSTIIEPTSGNTGIGLALAGAVKGYRVIITLPEKMSKEKCDVLKAFGAEVIRTPTEAAWDSEESHIGVAKKLNKEIPNSVILDQYGNPSNPLAHYDGTGEEIYKATGGKVDYFFASAGTGGTITGTAKKLKEKIPNIKVVGIDPFGSIIARPESLNDGIYSYKVEGIGYDFIPDVLNYQYIDEWMKSEDRESFVMSRRLIQEEGLLCGGSAGATVYSALKYAKEHNLKKSDRIVILLADSVRNYMTKFLDERWMENNDYYNTTGRKNIRNNYGNATIKDLGLSPAKTASFNTTIKEAYEILKTENKEQLPIVNEDGTVNTFVSIRSILDAISEGKNTFEDSVSKISTKFSNDNSLSIDAKLTYAITLFDKQTDIYAVDKNNDVYQIKSVDLLNYLTKKN